ncbi:MAG: EamA family transporter RarD [Eubacteriales bacterium]|nr:EamA family transporter RarD [Eubacteriales bacterium]
MNKKSLWYTVISYAMWGILPLYWHMLDNVDSLFILGQRILWSCVFSVGILLVTKRLPEFRSALKDKAFIKQMLPASALITVNWGVYIWAVNAGHVLDASLGYYLNPLIVFVFSVAFFHEKSGWTEYAAIALAAVGVVISAVEVGAFPWIAVILALSFALYGAVKKRVHAEPVIAMATETLLLLPIIALYLLFAPVAHSTIASLNWFSAALLVFSGVITATPLMLFAKGVNDLPFITVGFVQFLSPTLMLLCGVLLLNETLTTAKLISFAFIWAGLAVYTWGMIRKARAEKAKAAADKNNAEKAEQKA